MKLTAFPALLLSLLITGCTTPAYTTIVNGQREGYDGRMYERAAILAFDGRRFAEPASHIGVPAGNHRLLVRVSRTLTIGAAPEESEVAFDVAFKENRQYYVDGWYSGVRVYEEDHMHLLDLSNAKIVKR